MQVDGAVETRQNVCGQGKGRPIQSRSQNGRISQYDDDSLFCWMVLGGDLTTKRSNCCGRSHDVVYLVATTDSLEDECWDDYYSNVAKMTDSGLD